MQIVTQRDQWPSRVAGSDDWQSAGAYDDDYASWDTAGRVPASSTWYHVSPDQLRPGDVLAPGHGSQWRGWYNTEHNISPKKRVKWVWMEPDQEGAEQWTNGHGTDHIYKVQPSHDPYPWNGTGQHGHVAGGATVLEEVPMEQRSR